MKTINLLPKSVSRQLQFELIANQLISFWLLVAFSLIIFTVLIWLSIFYLRAEIQNVNNTIVGQKEVLSSSNTKELEMRVSALNQDIGNIKRIQEQHVYMSSVLEEVVRLMPAGLRLDALTFNRGTGKIEVGGFAQSRTDIIDFWSNVRKSDKFKDINFPLENLNEAQNADFSFVLYAKVDSFRNQ